MSLDEQLPPPGEQDPQQDPQLAPPPVAEQPKGTSGLAIAGLILAFLIAPVGFVLSLIAIFKTGAGKAKGRGLAVAGLVLSSLFVVGAGAVIIVAVNAVSDSNILDAGCTDGKEALLKSSSDVTATSLQATIDGLNAAAAKSTHDDVKAATLALADDYKQLLQAMNTGTLPDGLEDKITKDGEAYDALCTVGS